MVDLLLCSFTLGNSNHLEVSVATWLWRKVSWLGNTGGMDASWLGHYMKEFFEMLIVYRTFIICLVYV